MPGDMRDVFAPAGELFGTRTVEITVGHGREKALVVANLSPTVIELKLLYGNGATTRHCAAFTTDDDGNRVFATCNDRMQVIDL